MKELTSLKINHNQKSNITFLGFALFYYGLLNHFLERNIYKFNAGLLTAFSFLVFYLISIYSSVPEYGSMDTIIWKPKDARPSEPMPRYKDYRVQSYLILLATIAMIIRFW